MATAVPYKDKDGRIVSYQIQVFRGRDSAGKKLKPYTESWKVPETYKSEKAIKKALEKAMGEFEARCKEGKISVDTSTLSEYCRRYIELKRGNKKKSVAFYESLMPRIDAEIGFIRLDKLRAKHLDDFYLKLQQEGIRKDTKAVARDSLISERNKQKLTNKALGDLTGLTPTTVGIAMKKRNVNLLTAEKLSSALNRSVSDLFEIITLGDKEGLSAKTVGHYHTFIHSVLEMACQKGDMALNVASRATPPAIVKKEAEYLEIDDIIRIRECLENQEYQKKELFYVEDPNYNKEQYLFIQENGNVMDPHSLNHWIIDFQKAENLPHIYPHKFRHSQASILLYSGIDIVTVAGRLGHAQSSTTGNLYGHILRHADRRASDAVASALYGKR